MKARDGFSLVEITMSLLLLSFLIAGLGSLVVRTQQQYNDSLRTQRVSEALRTAENAIATLLKMASADPYNTGSAGLTVDYLGRARLDNFRARSDFNPADGVFTQMFEDARVYVASDTLYIQWSGTMEAQPVATPVNDLLFEFYDANRVLIADPALIPATAVTAKVMLETVGATAAANYRSETWVFLRNIEQ